MIDYETVTLHKDCLGILVPVGDAVQLKKGQEVTITQSLGGSYTVNVEGNMVRIDASQADALGKEPAPPLEDLLNGLSLEEQVWAQLRTCYDPEIPVNIVDLGLIYNCQTVTLTDGGTNVFVEMTLTAPGCGMGPVIVMDVKQKLKAIPAINDAEVELVFDPPWDRNRMSEAARLQLGLL